MLKKSKTFRGYARSYNIEIKDWLDPLVQSEASKPVIKDFFDDLLNEIKGLKCQITVKVLLRKYE